jgi:hypothetical protein
LKLEKPGASSPARILLGVTIFAFWSLVVDGAVLLLTGHQGIAAGVAIVSGLVAAPAFTSMILGPRQEHQQHGGMLTLLRGLFVLMTVAYGLSKILSFMLIVVAELGGGMLLARISNFFESIADFFEDQLDSIDL